MNICFTSFVSKQYLFSVDKYLIPISPKPLLSPFANDVIFHSISPPIVIGSFFSKFNTIGLDPS